MNLERRQTQVLRLAEFWTRQKDAGNVNNAACIEAILQKSISLEASQRQEILQDTLKGIYEKQINS